MAFSHHIGTTGSASLEDLSHEDALQLLESELREENFNDMERICNVAKADQLIGSILRKDTSLRAVLADNQRSLSIHSEKYIEASCAEAEDFVKLYREVTECETKLENFENEITDFQTRLTDTAEGIVKMQQETLHLVHQIENRKSVSQRMKDVYDALNECDIFCQSIAASSTVDKSFMDNIRLLESKISFLADNDDLLDSAVYQEIQPKLLEAAQKGGQSLQKYLLKRFMALAEGKTNVALQQQAIERQGQYAFSFLSRYNIPIAEDLARQYIRIMSEVYLKQMKGLSKSVSELTPYSARLFEPIVSGEMKSMLETGRDSVGYVLSTSTNGGVTTTTSTPSLSMPPAASPSMAVSQSQRRSVSMTWEQRMKSFKEKIHTKMGDGLERKREATFFEKLTATKCVASFQQQLIQDPVMSQELMQTTCWNFPFNELICKCTNMVTNESKFIAHFFYNDVGNPDEEENMLRLVLDKALHFISNLFAAEGGGAAGIHEITDPTVLLGGLRVLEICKNSASNSPDPLPLLLLAQMFEQVSNALFSRLKYLLQCHITSIADANSIDLERSASKQQFTNASNSQALQRNLAEQISHDPALTIALGAHELTRIFAAVTGQTHLFNTLYLEGSRVSVQFGRKVFDDRIAHMLSSCFNEMRKLINSLAQRHKSLKARNVFVVNNLTYILLAWNAACGIGNQVSGATAVPKDSNNWNDVLLEGGKTSTTMGGGEGGRFKTASLHKDVDHDNQGSGVGGREESMYATESVATTEDVTEEDNALQDPRSPQAPSFPDLIDLRRILREQIHQFILDDLSTSVLHQWYEYVNKFSEILGPQFFQANVENTGSQPSQHQDPTTGSASTTNSDNLSNKSFCSRFVMPPEMKEAEFTQVAQNFHRSWKDSFSFIGTNLKIYFGQTTSSSVEVGSEQQVPGGNTSGFRDASVSMARGATRERSISLASVMTQIPSQSLINQAVGLIHDENFSSQIVLIVAREYYELLLETNRRMIKMAHVFFAHSSTLQAKLVGNIVLAHEANRLLYHLSSAALQQPPGSASSPSTVQ